MTLGQKIKELRSKENLTQKDLAEKLIVTPQAVSRWESDDVEPSVGALKQMATIFNVSMDELLSQDPLPEETKPEPQIIEVEKPVIVEKPVYVEKPVIVEKVVEKKEEKPAEKKVDLGVCNICGRSIKDKSDLFQEKHRVGGGRGRGGHSVIYQYCKECHEKKLAEISGKNTHRLVFALLIGLLTGLVVFGIFAYLASCQTDENSKTTLWVMAPTLLVLNFTMISCFLLKNNSLFDIWSSIAEWSIHFPGIMFSFDVDGFKFFILMKLLFGFIGILIGIATFLLATALSMVLSIGFFPYAVVHNIKHKYEEQLDV